MTIAACILFTLSFQPVLAQENNLQEKPVSQQLPPGFMDSLKIQSGDSLPEKVKSPAGALFRSLALPGWGQFYTEQKVRGSITAVLETAFLTGMIIKYRDRNRLRDRLRLMEETMGSEWPIDDPERVALNSQIKKAGQKGGDYLAYSLTTLMLAMIDSYVSAHLYRFDRKFHVSAENQRVILAVRF